MSLFHLAHRGVRMVKSWFNVQHQVVMELVTSLGIMLPIVVFQAVQEPTNQRAGPKMAQIQNPSGEYIIFICNKVIRAALFLNLAFSSKFYYEIKQYVLAV